MKANSKQRFFITLAVSVLIFSTTAFTFVIEQFCTGTINQVTPTSIQFSISDGDTPAVGISGKVAVEIETEFQGVTSKTWLDVAKITVTQSSGSSVRCTIEEHIKNSYSISPEQYMQQPNNKARIQWRLAQ